jgi:hypothetical protein
MLFAGLGCRQVSPHLADRVAKYATADGNKILLSDGTRAYIGTKYIPPEADALRDFGAPVKSIRSGNVRCVVMHNFTFAVSNQDRFECNGFTFEVRRRTDDFVIINALCTSLSMAGCDRNSKGPPFEYEYAYIPHVGIEWIKFTDDPKIRGDILRHSGGGRILGS